MIGMRWDNVVFLHWRAAAERIRLYLPRGLEPERFDGSAWVSLVGLNVTALGIRSQQLNVRTYVVGERGPGIHLLDVQVDHPLPLAARLFGIPYHLYRALDLSGQGGMWRLRARDVAVDVALLADQPPSPARPGFETFVLERYRVYAELPGGLLYSVEIAHPPWQVRPLVVLGESPAAPLTLGDGGPVAAHYSEGVDMRITVIRRSQRPAAETGARIELPPEAAPGASHPR
jgi:uncharacterized protein YqjF (DUF2071 family)